VIPRPRVVQMSLRTRSLHWRMMPDSNFASLPLAAACERGMTIHEGNSLRRCDCRRGTAGPAAERARQDGRLHFSDQVAF
jgi:hypothetical protein